MGCARRAGHAGVWGDSTRIRAIEHEGKHFRVRGPLNVPRSPQGHPLIVQAGSSENGKKLAAHYAEAVFTAHQTLADAQAFYADLKARTVAAGRDRDSIKILPGIVPVIGSTEAEALRHAMWIPLGPKASEGIREVVRLGHLDERQVLEGLPHPSGANAERIAYFLGRKKREHLSPKTNPTTLDQIRMTLMEKVRCL